MRQLFVNVFVGIKRKIKQLKFARHFTVTN